jgi:hypothetical protein
MGYRATSVVGFSSDAQSKWEWVSARSVPNVQSDLKMLVSAQLRLLLSGD